MGPSRQPEEMDTEEWEGALRAGTYRPDSVTSAISAAFGLAVLDVLDADEAAGPSDSRRGLYQRLGVVLGVSTETLRLTFLGRRALRLGELFRALEDPELGPRFAPRLSTALVEWGWMLHRDKVSGEGEVGLGRGERLVPMSPEEHRRVMETRVRADVARLAAMQDRAERTRQPMYGVDWRSIRAVLAPPPVLAPADASTSWAVRATGLTSLAHTVRGLFRAQPELTSREVRRLVNEAAAEAQQRKGRTGPKIDNAQVDRALHRLKERGEVESVRRGVYRATDQLRRR